MPVKKAGLKRSFVFLSPPPSWSALRWAACQEGLEASECNQGKSRHLPKMLVFIHSGTIWALGGGLLGSDEGFASFLLWSYNTKKKLDRVWSTTQQLAVPLTCWGTPRQKEYHNCYKTEAGSSSAFHFCASSQEQAMRRFFLSLLSFVFLWASSSRIVTPASFTHSVPSCLSAKKLHLCLSDGALGSHGISSVPLLAKAKSIRNFLGFVSVLIPFPQQSVMVYCASWL